MVAEIEMKGLLGHTEDSISSAEEGTQHKEKTGHCAKSEKRLTSPTRIKVFFMLVLLSFLFGILLFVFGRIYVSSMGTIDTFESDKKQSQNTNDKEEHEDETSELVDRKPYHTATKANNDCEENPKNCHNSTDSIIEDGAGKHQGSIETNHEISNNQMTIVDGIDDKDVYCEDLSQYQEWHNTTITKNDGVMYRVVKQMDHDKKSFTQGLTYARGKLFESAGRYGQSTVRILDRGSAFVEKKVSMERKLFAEGITYYKDTLVQITWKSQRGFIYNITTLEEIDSFYFKTTLNEGWGITWDRCNDELIVTDGSPNLHFWDPNSMSETRRVKVRRMDGSDALELNEIEFWRGRVLANVWYEDVILVINPETGVVEKEYDFSSLWPKRERQQKRADVLNGISISEDPNVLYFTGKLWGRMYSIRLWPDL